MAVYIGRGPLGSKTNLFPIDKGTLARSHSLPPGIKLEPIPLTPKPKDWVTPKDQWNKKFDIKLGIYRELGLAGQIAEKFASLPYRKGGNITFKTGKLKGKGLVCTSFAKIFGALWFTGDPKKQMRLVERDEKGKIKRRKKGEPAPSPARVYAKKFGGSMVSESRLTFNDFDYLDRSRLYAIVTYSTKVGEKTKDLTNARQHIWFLIFSKSMNDWVRLESTGSLKGGGKGPGPGIYPLKSTKRARRMFYEVWDWGYANKPRNPDIEEWEFT